MNIIVTISYVEIPPAEYARRIGIVTGLLLEILDRVDDPAVLRNTAKAINHFREIESKLLSVGAQAEKDEGVKP